VIATFRLGATRLEDRIFEMCYSCISKLLTSELIYRCMLTFVVLSVLISVIQLLFPSGSDATMSVLIFYQCVPNAVIRRVTCVIFLTLLKIQMYCI